MGKVTAEIVTPAALEHLHTRTEDNEHPIYRVALAEIMETQTDAHVQFSISTRITTKPRNIKMWGRYGIEVKAHVYGAIRYFPAWTVKEYVPPGRPDLANDRYVSAVTKVVGRACDEANRRYDLLPIVRELNERELELWNLLIKHSVNAEALTGLIQIDAAYRGSSDYSTMDVGEIEDWMEWIAARIKEFDGQG